MPNAYSFHFEWYMLSCRSAAVQNFCQEDLFLYLHTHSQAAMERRAGSLAGADSLLMLVPQEKIQNA